MCGYLGVLSVNELDLMKTQAANSHLICRGPDSKKEVSSSTNKYNNHEIDYKFNLVLPKLDWTGTKGCRKKNLINLQWLRNIKDRKYSILRPDILLSKKKYSDIFFVENGGWHFTNIKSPKDIKYKLSSYLHHIEYDEKPMDVNEIENIINKKMAIYDLNLDKKLNKLGEGKKLELYDMNKLPPYIKENKKKFEGWLD